MYVEGDRTAGVMYMEGDRQAECVERHTEEQRSGVCLSV